MPATSDCTELARCDFTVGLPEQVWLRALTLSASSVPTELRTGSGWALAVDASCAVAAGTASGPATGAGVAGAASGLVGAVVAAAAVSARAGAVWATGTAAACGLWAVSGAGVAGAGIVAVIC